MVSSDCLIQCLISASSLESQVSQAGLTILAVSIPFSLESGTIPSIPATKFPVTLSASFSGTSDAAVATLQAALKAGHIVDIDVLGYGEESWEQLEDLLTKATADASSTGFIILGERPGCSRTFRIESLISDHA